MKGRTQEERLAMRQRSAMHREAKQRQAERVQKAARDVFDGTCDSCTDAARGRGVPVQPVRDAVAKMRAEAGMTGARGRRKA